MQEKKRRRMPLFRWIWRAYWQTALAPLLLVEIVFLAIYFISISWVTEYNVRMVRETANAELERICRQQAEVMNGELSGIARGVILYQQQAALRLNQPVELAPVDAARLVSGPDGVYYSATDRPEGGAAVFYSGIRPVGSAERDKAGRLLQLQDLMKSMKEAHPLVAAIYINTYDSLNVIYPYFPVLEQYAPKMDIPSFNFYYEADAAHNPQRTVRWTDTYLDPAGNGWMTSAVAPVYRGDFLEGVVGIDVTVSSLIQKMMELNIPWDGYSLLVSKDGTILVLPQQGERDFSLDELTSHTYTEAITQEMFKPEAFNLYNRAEWQDISPVMQLQPMGVKLATLGQSERMVAWSTIADTGWKFVVIVPLERLYASANAAHNRLKEIGTYMVVGLLSFYVLFFLYLYYLAYQMSRRVGEPLTVIDAMVQKIGEGEYRQEPPAMEIEELDNTAALLVEVGHTLEEAIRRLSEKTAEAEQASRAKSEFLSSMSHELRTPLNAILGFAQVIEYDKTGKLSDTQREHVQEIITAGKLLLDLINQVLDLAKIESGHLQAQREALAIRPIVEECLKVVEPLAEVKQVMLQLAAVDAQAAVWGDRLFLRQVLLNLLSNAIKYNKPQGQVAVAVRKADNAWCIQVQDSGIGIPPEAMAAIFEPFYRVLDKQSLTEGSGIGLAVAKQLMGLMGGEIGVESRPEGGSQFWIVLPQAPLPASLDTGGSLVPAAAVPVETGRAALNILLVEDNRANQKVAQLMLKKLGAEVTLAIHGEVAVAQFAAATYDLILMDCSMPVMDGYTATRQIRERETAQGLKRTPIIAMTANVLQEDKERCYAAGMDDHIAKPISVDQLSVILAKWTANDIKKNSQ